jgi:glycosyltransferase involved in cell wall biosynthesis
MKKPSLIVVALSINPNGGSEPGKGWWWGCALSRFFKIYVITQRHSIELCKDQPIVIEREWCFYPTKNTIITWKFPWGLIHYRRWLHEALTIASSIKDENLVGLHHVTLGSFRYLPSYEKLKIPYILGPLGGGEVTPWSLIWNRPVPLAHKFSEIFRRIFNYSFALNPKLRATINKAELVLATSDESEKVIQAIGARKTCVVFPDALERNDDSSDNVANPRNEGIKTRIKLVWQGRPLWWKGPDLALALLAHLTRNGLPVELDMIGQWENQPMKEALLKEAKKYGIQGKVHFLQSVNANEFKKLLRNYHAFVATSLHDSGGIPLIEAQAAGLPCITLGLGGNRLAAAPYDGKQIMPCDNKSTFLNESLERIKSWHLNPQKWLEESRQATEFSQGFGIVNIERIVEENIFPTKKNNN